MNHGGFDTCVAHGFAGALSSGLMSTYDVPVHRETIVSVVEALYPCWEGYLSHKLAKEWNEKESWLKDTDLQKRYRVHVKSQRFGDLKQARAEFCKLDGLLHFVGVINMDVAGRHGMLARLRDRHGRTQQLGRDEAANPGYPPELRVRRLHRTRSRRVQRGDAPPDDSRRSATVSDGHL